MVNDEENTSLYAQYKALVVKEKNIVFGGRLDEYKYYDLDQDIIMVLEKAKELMK